MASPPTPPQHPLLAAVRVMEEALDETAFIDSLFNVASRLRAYLDAYTSPRRNAPVGDVDLLPLPRRRGEAFCSLLEELPSDGLPVRGGTATSVMVMIDLEALRSGLGLAETSTGELISATEARRLACTANIVPGRPRWPRRDPRRGPRQPPVPVRAAQGDGAPRPPFLAEGCDIPAAWCEAHYAAKP
jgi:hypothetical protein